MFDLFHSDRYKANWVVEWYLWQHCDLRIAREAEMG